MAVETDADRLASYFSLDENGITATVDGQSVQGVFESEYAAVTFGAFEVDSASPIFYCNTSDVSAVANGAAVTIDGQAYTVRSNQPTGDGVTGLALNKGA